MDNAVFREENARRHRRRRRQALGLVLAVLILVGLGTIATSVVGLVGSLFDDTDRQPGKKQQDRKIHTS